MTTAGWIILLALLQLGDYFSTRYAVELQHNKEGNPMLRFFMRFYGLRAVLIAKGIIVVAVGVTFPSIAAPMCIPFAIAVASNVILILKSRSARA